MVRVTAEVWARRSEVSLSCQEYHGQRKLVVLVMYHTMASDGSLWPAIARYIIMLVMASDGSLWPAMARYGQRWLVMLAMFQGWGDVASWNPNNTSWSPEVGQP